MSLSSWIHLTVSITTLSEALGLGSKEKPFYTKTKAICSQRPRASGFFPSAIADTETLIKELLAAYFLRAGETAVLCLKPATLINV